MARRKTGSDQGLVPAAAAPARKKTRGPNRTSWKPGQSGNPRGRPRSGEALSEVLRAEITPLGIIQRMQGLADHAQSETVRYHALAWLAERGWGKAPLEVKVTQRNPYAARVKGLTIVQLEALAQLDEPLDEPLELEAGDPQEQDVEQSGPAVN